MDSAEITHFLLWFRDGVPEWIPCRSEAECREWYDKAVLNWSDVFLLEVKCGPGPEWRRRLGGWANRLNLLTQVYPCAKMGT